MKPILFALLALCSTAATASTAYDALLDEHWAWYQEQFPTAATYRGDHSRDALWDDNSPAARNTRYAARGEFLKRLQTIDTAALHEDQKINLQVLKRTLEQRRARHELGLDLISLNMRDGPQHRHEISAFMPFETEADYRRWLARLRALPAALAGEVATLEEGIAKQRVQSLAVMERVPAQVQNLLQGDIEQNSFYAPFRDMPASIPAATADALRSEAARVIAGDVRPAYQAFHDFLTDRYLPACRQQPGIGSLPGGKALYEFLARDFTTTELTPLQIHELGKQEVARILSEMEAVKREVNFEGDLNAFNQFLRTDPQFYYETPEALFNAYLAVSKRLDPELVKLFGVLPRMPYGLRQIPDEAAPDTTTAYYMAPASNGTRAGYYYVNLYRPEMRPKYEMEVLSVHEAVPGHHLQIALAQENPNIAPFRHESDVTAFVEGWGLYSERLGYDMGLYQDPYSRYGQLTYDMWRAVRLVVDTGIHYFGWSREQAIDYFRDHAGKSETDIVNEIDRYIGWPGQALAYKIGQLKILELRADAEQLLGERFDIRGFHDTVLGAGSIPLDVLEQRVIAWRSRIAAQN